MAGAGLWVHGNSDVQVSLSVISRNEARNNASFGGGIGGALSGAGHIALMNTTISGNIAATGAGIGMSGPKGTNIELKFMTVAGNHATRGARISGTIASFFPCAIRCWRSAQPTVAAPTASLAK